MEHRTANRYYKERFGRKIYRIAVDGGFTCPVRDGSIDTRGCIFCSEHGSGDFCGDRSLSITEQIEQGKDLLKDKIPKEPVGYIAYFQAFTGTYAPVEKLERLYREAMDHPDIAALAIATRPDCLPEETLDLIYRLNREKPVYIELGLQSIHERTAEYIRRGYKLPVYEDAVRKLSVGGIEIITHVILGLPGETRRDMLETAAYLADSPISGVKIQLLHVLAGTDLAKEYEQGKFECLSMEEYTDIVRDFAELLPEHMVLYRMTGDGARSDLIAPMWSTDKKRVLNMLRKKLGMK